MHLHSKFYALVEQEHSQLEECPTIAASALNLRSGQLVSTLSDACKVLERYCAQLVQCLLDESIANAVIQPRLESSFASTQPFQELSASSATTPSAFGRFVLQTSPNPTVFISNLSYLLTTEFLSM